MVTNNPTSAGVPQIRDGISAHEHLETPTIMQILQQQQSAMDALTMKKSELQSQIVAATTSSTRTVPTTLRDRSSPPVTTNNPSQVVPASGNPGSQASLLNILKSATFYAFHGNGTERSSLRVRSFILGIRKVTSLCKNDSETQEVDIAVCLLRDHADLWYARATNDGATFSNLLELEKAMLAGFVPANERAMARVALIQLRYNGSLEKHIGFLSFHLDQCYN